jgi:predicted nucleotidyltransferase
MNHYRIAQKKYKQSVWVAKLFRFIPGILMIAVCNSLACNKAREESDIDLFIIARRGSLWTVRFFALVLLSALKMRHRFLKSDDSEITQKQARRNAVCISFILSDDNLNIEQYKISENDPYLGFWVRCLVPLYSLDDTYERFQKENSWSQDGEQALWYAANYKRRVKKTLLSSLVSFLTPVGIGENLYKRFQLWKIPLRVQELAFSFDTRVILSDKVIKTHINDRRLSFKNSLDAVV